ncbi:unnamed protein product [Mytilus coruscus]|uniref:ISXO2-like transposase domain-containing protein n=1 Tax=Mytilus coruscus TaxID=42192 RepID=A0A6J8EUK0_MYTCO|nr:unnamed protein product [Mytilus coruscus]
MPDVTKTSIVNYSLSVSSAITQYLPLEPPSSSPVKSVPDLTYTVTSKSTYQACFLKSDSPMLTSTSSDQEPYSHEITSRVQYIFDQDLMQNEEAEKSWGKFCILLHLKPQQEVPTPTNIKRWKIQHFLKNDTIVLGESMGSIEIDESLSGKKRKYNRGSGKQDRWVFGMLEKGTRKVILRVVEKCNRETLEPIIKENEAEGSTIHLDC